MDRALDEVAAWEQGTILNDHYDLSRYVLRRATHLGVNPIYKNLNIDWFRIARADAAEVFDSQSQELSVQEIRRRELRKEIEPLLPFPTTGNTQTIDSFRSYPQTEWTSEESTQSPTSEVYRTLIQVNSSRTAPVQEATRNSLGGSPPSAPHRSAFDVQPAQQDSKVMNGLSQTANIAMAFNEPEQTEQGRRFDLSSSPFPDTSFSSSSAIDPRLAADSSLTSVEDNGTPMQLDNSGTQPPADPELIRKIIDRLGHKPASNTTTAANELNQGSKIDAPKVPQELYYAEGVSALGNRGISLPVKTVKRARNDSPDSSEESNPDNDTRSSSEEMQPPTAKRSKVAASKRVVLKLKPPKLQAAMSAQSKPTRTKAPASKDKTNHIESVISGNALPRTAAEATSAAETRLARLLANHNMSRKASKLRSVPAGAEPDFMPEFFNVNNFSKGKKVHQIRCACGVVVNDKRGMIACDQCGVWQHMACMRDGVPEETEDHDYFCHVCEPWVHRELVARLRRENPLD